MSVTKKTFEKYFLPFIDYHEPIEYCILEDSIDTLREVLTIKLDLKFRDKYSFFGAGINDIRCRYISIKTFFQIIDDAYQAGCKKINIYGLFLDEFNSDKIYLIQYVLTYN